MGSLLVLLAFLFVVSRCAGSCLRLTERSLPRGRRDRRGVNPSPEAGLPPAVKSRAPVLEETPLEALQRRFAEGQISMEHYEREVGRLFGLKSFG